jgi:hypothetical protein
MSVHDELRRKREAREDGCDPYAAAPPMDENEVRLVEIRQRAEHVQSAHASKVEAIMNERQQAQAILRRAIQYGMPAIEALAGKIETYSEKVTIQRPGSGALASHQNHARHWFLKGVLIVDRFNAVQGSDRDVVGSYGGVGLYLLENGAMALGRRSGAWSRRIGELSELNVEMEPVTIPEALKQFRVEQILEGLLAMLAAQGALAEQAAEVRAKAQKLTAALSAMTEFLQDG